MEQLETPCALKLLEQLPYPYDLVSIQLLEELPFDDILDLAELEPKPPKSLPFPQPANNLPSTQIIKGLEQPIDSPRIKTRLDKLQEEVQYLKQAMGMFQPRKKILGRSVLSLQYAAQCKLRQTLTSKNLHLEVRKRLIEENDYDYTCYCDIYHQFHWFSKTDIDVLVEHSNGCLNRRDIELIVNDVYLQQSIGSTREWPEIAALLLEPENKRYYDRLERIFLYATGDFIETMAMRPEWGDLFWDQEPEPLDARLS